MPEVKMRTISYAQAINEALHEEMERDEKVFLMGEDVALSAISPATAGLGDRFGHERVRNTPISELGFTGAAVGAAMAGYRPVLDMRRIDFMMLAIDPIANQAAKLRYMLGGQVNIPLVIRAPEGGGSQNGPTHSQCLEAWFIQVPGLRVIVPSDPADVKGLLKSAIREDNPVLFVEYRSLYSLEGPVPDGDYTEPIGRAAVKREGRTSPSSESEARRAVAWKPRNCSQERESTPRWWTPGPSIPWTWKGLRPPYEKRAGASSQKRDTKAAA